MTDSSSLLSRIARILRSDPALRSLAPNWAAEDARAHVFVGEPPVGAANAGRAPYVVIDLADVRQSPLGGGDRRDAVTTATVTVRLVARRDVDGLSQHIKRALAATGGRQLDDAGHVLSLALDRGAPERLGPCEAAELKLAVRLLCEPGT